MTDKKLFLNNTDANKGMGFTINFYSGSSMLTTDDTGNEYGLRQTGTGGVYEDFYCGELYDYTNIAEDQAKTITLLFSYGDAGVGGAFGFPVEGMLFSIDNMEILSDTELTYWDVTLSAGNLPTITFTAYNPSGVKNRLVFLDEYYEYSEPIPSNYTTWGQYFYTRYLNNLPLLYSINIQISTPYLKSSSEDDDITPIPLANR